MPISKDEFVRRFQGRMLLFVTEAWCIRRDDRRNLAETLDVHHLEAKKLLREMYEALYPPQTPFKAEAEGNGKVKQ